MRVKEKQFLKWNSRLSAATNRHDFKVAREIFDKRLRQCEFIANEIENLSTENPNEFWKRLNH